MLIECFLETEIVNIDPKMFSYAQVMTCFGLTLLMHVIFSRHCE